jgi:hypothetical protein
MSAPTPRDAFHRAPIRALKSGGGHPSTDAGRRRSIRAVVSPQGIKSVIVASLSRMSSTFSFVSTESPKFFEPQHLDAVSKRRCVTLSVQLATCLSLELQSTAR